MVPLEQNSGGTATAPAPTPLKTTAGLPGAPQPTLTNVSPSGAPAPAPVSPVPATVTPGASVAPMPPPTSLTSLAPGVNVTPTNPAQDLRSQTILPGPMADRFSVAQSQLKSFNDATEPYYQKSLRDATSQAATAGQLGSGQLRTSLGDLANQRGLQVQTQGQNFLDSALTGSIDDAYKNLGLAQQQQGFQAGQQENAFNQGVTQTGLQDSLTNSATNRSLQQLLAGEQGNPADTQLILSQLFGNQASQAGSALSNMIGGTVNRNAQTASNTSLQQLLGQLGIGGAPSAPTAPTSGGTSGGTSPMDQTLLNLGILN